jgi:hypothetical protein
VIFDRWGGCTLFSGVYLMHVSEAIKSQLEDEAGKCIEVDATEVKQPLDMDGLIKKLTVLGPASDKHWSSAEGMTVTVIPAFEDGHAPEFIIRVESTSPKPITLCLGSLALTLLGERDKSDRFSPSDGPSDAVLTRQSFWDGEHPRLKGYCESSIGGVNKKWQWTVTQPHKLQGTTLIPKEAFEIRILFKLPAGEYDFLAGYGGGAHEGQCAASNLLAFDVKADGTASLVKVAGR